MISSRLIVGCCISLSFATVANAAIIGVTQVNYRYTATDRDGNTVRATISDLYLMSDNASDVVVNVYNANISNTQGADEYYQAPGAMFWDPLVDSDHGEASTRIDSFVTIGGIEPSSNGMISQVSVLSSALDPNFGGLLAPAPGEDAGWFNSNPTNLNGAVNETTFGDVGLGLFVGRFSLEGDDLFELEGGLSVTWNTGLGTDPHQESFDIGSGQVVAVPGAGGLACLALVRVRRRRRN